MEEPEIWTIALVDGTETRYWGAFTDRDRALARREEAMATCLRWSSYAHSSKGWSVDRERGVITTPEGDTTRFEPVLLPGHVTTDMMNRSVADMVANGFPGP